MKKIHKILIVLLFIGGIMISAFWQLGYFDRPATYNIVLDQNLKDAASIPIGVAVNSYQLENDTHYRSLIVQHFNSIVAEWQMKMRGIFLGPDSYEWYHSDYLVNFGLENNMYIHGHTLLWHESIPDWLEAYPGTDEEFRQLIKTYIQTVVGRYQGQIDSWDVVNEAFTEDGYRDTLFYRRMGPNYLADAFRWAHEADPDVKLYYNDYSMLANPAKIDYVISQLQALIDAGVPIHGMGIQGHLKLNSPDMNLINASLQKWNAVGLDIRISEMDVALNSNGRYRVFSQTLADAQRDYYYNAVKLFLDCPKLTGITVWGFSDADSWIPDHHGHIDWPLLFDDAYRPKPAAEGFLSALQGR
jgi:endo-1,4-beta-xylanase